MSGQRFRLKFMFWLDVSKPDEFALSEQIEELKQRRSYVKTIRDGIRLICDLRAGRSDVLFELFPWIRTELMPPTLTVNDSQLQYEISQLKQLILEQGSTSTPSLNYPLLKPSSAPVIAAKAAPVADANAIADNFLNFIQ